MSLNAGQMLFGLRRRLTSKILAFHLAAGNKMQKIPNL